MFFFFQFLPNVVECTSPLRGGGVRSNKSIRFGTSAEASSQKKKKEKEPSEEYVSNSSLQTICFFCYYIDALKSGP